MYVRICVMYRDLKPENILLDDNGEFEKSLSSYFSLLDCTFVVKNSAFTTVWLQETSAFLT